MISKKELNPNNYPLDAEQEKNFEHLYICINAIRIAYGKPMRVTSGVRSLEDQKRINPKALASNHIKAAAVDIADAGGDLWNWLMQNIKLLELLGVYLESRAKTPTWVHLQIVPPKSGSRIFNP